MNLNEIERSAAGMEEFPEGLTQPEQLLFLSLRNLYRAFRGGISKEQAGREKAKILKAFDSARRDQELYAETVKMRNRLARYYTEIERSGDELAIKMLRIWDGTIKLENEAFGGAKDGT